MKNRQTGESINKTPAVLGLLAHVDAGKTTLAEALLYTCKKLRAMGRVDHKNSFLDTYSLERQRGITIFSKQAQLDINGLAVTLLDTPGHADLLSEAERVVSVLDYAVLIISGPGGVSGHTHTLFKLLEYYNVPVFIFVNKMDIAGADKAASLDQLKNELSSSCIDFSKDNKELFEEAATGSEKALEEFIETGRVSGDTLKELISSRSIFPVFFGSALRLWGIEDFSFALSEYIKSPVYPEEFSAEVYKISHDEKGERLTHLKVTGGSLKVRSAASAPASSKEGAEKINQIRIYDGAKYTLADEALPGCVCTVTGLSKTRAGDCLGAQKPFFKSRLESPLTYKIILPEGYDASKALALLGRLEEEDPQLHLTWNSSSGEISIQVMGKIQLEILKSLIKERFNLDVSFGEGSIIYKETIKDKTEGLCHFEPSGHYAEVRLLLEPLPSGSGLLFETNLSEDILDKNWQRLILSSLKEKRHSGVLTGALLTDIKVTLTGGKANIKHTEGGDFREAACRAVRQGLMCAESVLLEPCCSFKAEVPAEMSGRVMSDITRMGGNFDGPYAEESAAVITGEAPFSGIKDYPLELTSFSHGAGRISLEFSGYKPCHNAEEVILKSAYSAERDTENPSSSVFFLRGSGCIVPWNEVREHMRLGSGFKEEAENRSTGADPFPSSKSRAAGEDELKEIFERTYGSGSYNKNKSEYLYQTGQRRPLKDTSPAKKRAESSSFPKPKPKLLLVDGYNIIFAWEELKDLAQGDISAARGRLMEILANYQAFCGLSLILVFDGYKVKGNPGESFKYLNIDVVYTKEGETADLYIEKKAAACQKDFDVSVATSDSLEQLSIFSHGARRISAAELYMLIEQTARQIHEKYLDKSARTGAGLLSGLSKESALKIEAIMKQNDAKIKQPANRPGEGDL